MPRPADSPDRLARVTAVAASLPVPAKTGGVVSSRSGPMETIAGTDVRPGIEPRRRIKRLIDVTVSLTALCAFAPVMAVLALLVKLESRGPALFVQQRVGKDGATFNLLKFRTMRVDAESCTGPVFARPHDPRCTRIGQFMRRHSLDELPQFVNVLRGEMSLVGPRPERPFFVEQFSQTVPRYLERHREMAGITGWAQVNGLRGDTSIEERVACDLYYVEHWSLALDLEIMARTALEMVRGHDAE